MYNFEVKFGWPMTIEAFSPLEKAYADGPTSTPEIRKIVTIAILKEMVKNLLRAL